ncbi:MAG: phosphatase [Gammaproteobacteria bacterium]|nr:phosphatase [Gammaproteobacteria bacterium]
MPDYIELHQGRIAMVPAPGNTGNCANSDLHALTTWGATILVTLVESHELAMLGLSHLEQRAQEAGLRWHHLPIRNMSTPTAQWLATWRSLSPRLHEALKQENSIAIHCWAGLGRTGLVSAMLLMEGGYSATRAIAQVRQARPGTIETQEQEQFVRRYTGVTG